MRCLKCKNHLYKIRTTIDYIYDEKSIIVHNVPALYCQVCKIEFIPKIIKANIRRMLIEWFRKYTEEEVDYETLKKNEEDDMAGSFGCIL